MKERVSNSEMRVTLVGKACNSIDGLVSVAYYFQTYRLSHYLHTSPSSTARFRCSLFACTRQRSQLPSCHLIEVSTHCLYQHSPFEVTVTSRGTHASTPIPSNITLRIVSASARSCRTITGPVPATNCKAQSRIHSFAQASQSTRLPFASCFEQRNFRTRIICRADIATKRFLTSQHTTKLGGCHSIG